MNRSKIAQGIAYEVPKYVFSRLMPLFIFSILFSYSIFVILFFKGKCVKLSDSNKIYIEFTDYPKWCAYLGVVSEVFSSTVFVGLFYLPLKKAFYMSKRDFSDKNASKNEFVFIMKINTYLSFISTFSTVLIYIFIAIWPRYWWVWTLDFPVNTITLSVKRLLY